MIFWTIWSWTTVYHFSAIRKLDADSALDSAFIEQEDEQVARMSVLELNTPDADSSLLQSSISNNIQITENEFIENSTTPPLTTTDENDSTDEYETRSIIELSDDNTADSAMDTLPYANHDVTTNEMIQNTTNQKWLPANTGMSFQNKRLS